MLKSVLLHLRGLLADASIKALLVLGVKLLLHNFKHLENLLISQIDLLSELLNCFPPVESWLVCWDHISQSLDLFFVSSSIELILESLNCLQRSLIVVIEASWLATSLAQYFLSKILVLLLLLLDALTLFNLQYFTGQRFDRDKFFLVALSLASSISSCLLHERLNACLQTATFRSDSVNELVLLNLFVLDLAFIALETLSMLQFVLMSDLKVNTIIVLILLVVVDTDPVDQWLQGCSILKGWFVNISVLVHAIEMGSWWLVSDVGRQWWALLSPEERSAVGDDIVAKVMIIEISVEEERCLAILHFHGWNLDFKLSDGVIHLLAQVYWSATFISISVVVTYKIVFRNGNTDRDFPGLELGSSQIWISVGHLLVKFIFEVFYF